MYLLSKRSRSGPVSAGRGKKLRGLTAVQEKNAQVTVERGAPNHSTTRKTSNHRSRPTRPTPWHIRRSDFLHCDARPCPKMHKGVADPITKTEDLFQKDTFRWENTIFYKNQMFIKGHYKKKNCKVATHNRQKDLVIMQKTNNHVNCVNRHVREG